MCPYILRDYSTSHNPPSLFKIMERILDNHAGNNNTGNPIVIYTTTKVKEAVMQCHKQAIHG